MARPALGLVWRALEDPNSQVQQFLGEVYQNAGDRVNNFVKSGTPAPTDQ